MTNNTIARQNIDLFPFGSPFTIVVWSQAWVLAPGSCHSFDRMFSGFVCVTPVSCLHRSTSTSQVSSQVLFVATACGHPPRTSWLTTGPLWDLWPSDFHLTKAIMATQCYKLKDFYRFVLRNVMAWLYYIQCSSFNSIPSTHHWVSGPRTLQQ